MSVAEYYKVEEVRRRYESKLLAVPGVVGVTTAFDPVMKGWVIVVYVESEEVKARVPSRLDNIPVKVVVTGKIGVI